MLVVNGSQKQLSEGVQVTSTTITSIPSTTELNTTLIEIDGFYDGDLAIIDPTGTTFQQYIDEYQQTGGKLIFADPLPILPPIGTLVRIVARKDPHRG